MKNLFKINDKLTKGMIGTLLLIIPLSLLTILIPILVYMVVLTIYILLIILTLNLILTTYLIIFEINKHIENFFIKYEQQH